MHYWLGLIFLSAFWGLGNAALSYNRCRVTNQLLTSWRSVRSGPNNAWTLTRHRRPLKVLTRLRVTRPSLQKLPVVMRWNPQSKTQRDHYTRKGRITLNGG